MASKSNIKFDAKRRRILNTVIENFDYFRQHPTHLAWAMMYWNGITNAGRELEQCQDNPKYAIIDAPLKTDDDKNLLYAAWGISYAHGQLMDAPEDWPLYSKSKKTLDQWVELKLSPRYPYFTLYPNRDSILQNFFITYGTGFGWTKDGYLDELGSENVGESIFHGYTRCENDVREDLRNRILGVLAGEECAFIRRHIDEWVNLYTSANWPEVNFRKRRRELEHQKQYVDSEPRKQLTPEELTEMRTAFYYDRLIEEASYWSEDQWRQAESQADPFIFYGYPLEVHKLSNDYLDRIFAPAAIFRSVLNRLDKFKTLDTSDPDYDKNVLNLIHDNTPLGWKIIEELTERRKNGYRELDKSYTRPIELYPRICEYSAITKIPNNAHPSYLKGAVELCQQIVQEVDWHQDDKEWAKKILATPLLVDFQNRLKTKEPA